MAEVALLSELDARGSLRLCLARSQRMVLSDDCIAFTSKLFEFLAVQNPYRDARIANDLHSLQKQQTFTVRSGEGGKVLKNFTLEGRGSSAKVLRKGSLRFENRHVPPVSWNPDRWNQRSRPAGARCFSNSSQNSSSQSSDRSSIECSRSTSVPGAGDVGPSDHGKVEDGLRRNALAVSPQKVEH
jgi:hypothetical protein